MLIPLINVSYCTVDFDGLKKNDISKSAFDFCSRIKVIEVRLCDFRYGNLFKGKVGAFLLNIETWLTKGIMGNTRENSIGHQAVSQNQNVVYIPKMINIGSVLRQLTV